MVYEGGPQEVSSCVGKYNSIVIFTVVIINISLSVFLFHSTILLVSQI